MAAQSEWLIPARSRLLRRISIARMENILDLGAGYGHVTGELLRRSDGRIIALDRVQKSLHEIRKHAKLLRVVGNGDALPLADSSLDLVFCQLFFIWQRSIEDIIGQIARVLRPGGFLLAIEPDYPSMIEHPTHLATGRIWSSALMRAEADPEVTRKLPKLLEKREFKVRVDLLERLRPPSPLRFDLLRGLPLTQEESHQLDQIENEASQLSSWSLIAHLPFFLITAER